MSFLVRWFLFSSILLFTLPALLLLAADSGIKFFPWIWCIPFFTFSSIDSFFLFNCFTSFFVVVVDCLLYFLEDPASIGQPTRNALLSMHHFLYCIHLTLFVIQMHLHPILSFSINTKEIGNKNYERAVCCFEFLYAVASLFVVNLIFHFMVE